MQDFKTYLQDSESPATTEVYVRYAKEFLKIAQNNLNVASIDKYRNFLAGKNYTRRTKVVKLAAVKKYLKFRKLSELGNYVKEIELRKEKKARVKCPLTEEHIRGLLNALAKMRSETIFRDRLLINLLVQTGGRISDILNLRLKDFDFEERVIFLFQDKQEEDHKVRLTEKIERLLREYLRHNPKIKDKLFFITRQAFDVILKRILVEIGLPKASAHKFRHFFVTYYFRAGVPVQYVQQLTGHKKLESLLSYNDLGYEDTQAYLKNNKIKPIA